MEGRAARFRRNILNEFALHSLTAVAAFRPAIPAARTWSPRACSRRPRRPITTAHAWQPGRIDQAFWIKPFLMPRLGDDRNGGHHCDRHACGGSSGSTSPAQIQRVAGLMLRCGLRQPRNVKQMIEG